MQHFHFIDLLCLVIDIHLGGIQKTKLEMEGVVFLINTVGSDITSEKRVQVILLAVRKDKEVFVLVPKTFCETWVGLKVETLY